MSIDKENITYEESRDLARHEDPKVRLQLAQRKDIRPEILYFLAEDQDPDVRRAIAENAAAPGKADVKLAQDGDGAVRLSLVEKISAVAPGLSASDKQRIHTSTSEVMELLAQDQLTHIRQVLSEALKDVANAPPEVIKRLAMDTEIVVAGPVLEFSPVLTDADLIEIIEKSPAKGGLNAISRRAQVSEQVADAVVATNDISAIGDLLANNSAQIREETLDGLVERAPGVELWHAPLVGRPDLPARAVTKLAHFVAENLLETLKLRDDLDESTLEAVRSAVHSRLSEEGGDEDENFDTMSPEVETPLSMARRLFENGRLDETLIANAMNAADYPFVYAAISVASDVKIKVVEKIFSEKSPKGIVAIIWKAGFSMKLAVNAQKRMASIPPSAILAPDKKGAPPLNEEEMSWQLEFFSDLSQKG